MKKPTYPQTCRGLWASAMVVAACLLPAVSSFAITVTVTTTADSGAGSLRDAIANAPADATINFAPGVTGAITLTNGELGISGYLTIAGPGAANLTISGNTNSRVFNISSNSTVTISGLTIAAGFNQGANGDGEFSTVTAGQGGGIYNAGNLALTSCTVSQNQAIGGDAYALASFSGAGSGGGIYSVGTLTLINCLITQNSASGGLVTDEYASAGDGFGGGIFSQGNLSMANCTISQNTVIGGATEVSDAGGVGDGDGGGLYIIQTALLDNCTIAGNSATGGGTYTQDGTDVNAGNGQGGGLFIINGGTPGSSPTVILTSCTISGNACTAGLVSTYGGAGGPGGAFGGGIYAATAPTLNNTIVSGNAVGSDGIIAVTAAPDVNGGVTSGGFNLIGDTDGSSGWLVGTTGADLLGSANPNLGPLQNNGGPTPTMALLSGSQAIDQGYGFGYTTDQRGDPRPVIYYPNGTLPTGGDGSDIGAFELSRTPPYLHVSANSILPILTLAWSEDSASGANKTAPYSGVILSHGALSNPGMWMNLMSPVRMINNMYTVRDTILPPGPSLLTNSAFYQLSGPSNTATNLYIVPAQTTAATQITTNGAALNGTTTPYGLGTLYWFVYGPDTSYGQSTATNGIPTSVNQTAVTQLINGLNPSSTYHFQLMVTDDWGTQYGDDQVFTTPAPPTPLPTVLSFAASSVAATAATLNGSVNGHGLPIGGWFEYGTDTNYGSSTDNNQFFTSSDYYAAQSYGTPITGLSPNTTYHYRAIASSMAGEGFGADTNFTTAPLPPTVATLPASSVVRTSATLSGTVNPNGSSTTVYFQYGTTTNYGSTTTPTVVNSAGTFDAIITGLTANTTYYFLIVATNGGGTSYGANTSFTTIGD